MRIMQLYRIEFEYKNHKKRLQSIKKTSSRQKIDRITSQQFYLTNEHKKIKINAEIFQQKQEISRREHTNSLMHRTIDQHSKKIKMQHQSNYLNDLPHRNSNKSIDRERIQEENAKLKEKIDKMKSVYKAKRRHSQLNVVSIKTQRQKNRQTDKQKLLALLKNQFKIEPTVVFPKCKAKTIRIESESDLYILRDGHASAEGGTNPDQP